MALLDKQLFIKESTIPGAGMGLFTEKFIPKGTRIIEYKGKVTTWEDADHQEGMNAYIFYVTEEHVIDSYRSKKSLARYANDAKGLKKIKGLKNNSLYAIDGVRVFIEAAEDIPEGGEILVGYGKEYWDIIRRNMSSN
jgi:SET domain-containing protein